MRRPSEEARDVALIAACAGVFYAVGIGSGSQLNSDDVLYAQMAREMLHSGNLLDNSWLGVVHFEKPPLLLWCLALSAWLFGFGEAALRLPITLWSLSGLCALYLLARSLGVARQAAFTAAGLLASSTFYLLMTRRPMTDIPLLACALVASALWLRGRDISAGTFAGLAVLAKGVAALPLLLPAFILQPRAAVRAAAVMLLVAAPWHIAQSLRYGTEFWSGYLGHHVAARMTSAVVPSLTLQEQLELLAREPVILALALIGLGLSGMQRFKQPVARFAVCWLALSVLPLIVSKTVLPHYLLPLIPALVLLATQTTSLPLFQKRLGPLLSAALVLSSLASNRDKLSLWLDPDFSPDEKAAGQRLAQLAKQQDLVGTYNLMHNSLVFYSGGLPISIYSDDDKFIEIQHAVLMMQRQAGHAGGLIELKQHNMPVPATAHRFIVTHSGSDSDKLEHIMRQAAPQRALYQLELGALSLINDAQEGELITR